MSIKLTETCFKGMAGAYAALFTPIDRKNRVNEEAIDAIVEYGIANGLRGFYLTGSTGGWFLLSPEERKTVWRRAVKAANGRCKLIAHVGDTSTDVSVALAKAAADVGVDWISSVAPPVFCNNFNRTYYHYKRVSEATDLPFMAYSIGSELVPARDIRFFDLPNVKGIKYTGRDYYAAQALKRDIDKVKETIWFAGCDEQLLCALALDNVFAGGIGTTYNIIPGHFAKICELAAKNDFRAAAKWQDEANQVVRLMIESDNWSYRKAMMKFVGIDCGPYRAPFEKLTAAQEKAYLKRFAALGIVKKGQARA
ncbi:MAG: dihydrodipicolinate synthase family protein [Kiritimatiellae bacterium]|nr:dihydrodipicolinate synthase family protein [Kiritimatiellia bacterium]